MSEKQAAYTTNQTPPQPPARPDLAAVLARHRAANAMIDALCEPRGTPGAREWLLSVPARPDQDPDLVIGAALNDIPRLVAYLLPLEAVRRAGDDLMECLAEFGAGEPSACAERYQVLGDRLAEVERAAAVPHVGDIPLLSMPEPAVPDLLEQLAAIEHERWSDWQGYVHARCQRQADGSLTIPADLVARWERQIATPYAELSEAEQQVDRDQVARYWHLVCDAAASDRPARPEWAAIEDVARRLYRAHQLREQARGAHIHVRGGTEAYVLAMLAAREMMLALGEALERPAAAPVDAAAVVFTSVTGDAIKAVVMGRDDGTEPEGEGDEHER